MNSDRTSSDFSPCDPSLSTGYRTLSDTYDLGDHGLLNVAAYLADEPDDCWMKLDRHGILSGMLSKDYLVES